MIRKMPKWMAGIALVLAVGASPLACGGGSGDEDMGGAPNDEDGTGGNDTDGTGGNDTDGSGGNDTDGSGGTDGEGGDNPGTGGTAPVDASIDDLISAICEWEYGCCDDGEVTYRLGTAAGNSVEDCVEYFTFQLHESNTTDNPFPGGTAGGLLGTLAYAVNLDRVEENAAGIGACVEAYQDMGCPTEAPEGPVYCEEGQAPDADPCALVNLFDPALEEGDRCTLALGQDQVGTNDVECAAGTTCLDAGGDNPEDFPICVQRGTDDQPCTEDADCDYNFYCAPDSNCTEKGDIGDDCTFNDEEPTPGDEDASCKAGLACDPIALICVNSCTENFPCLDNSSCPENFGCAPVQVGNDSTTWKACLALGTENADRCNDDGDCAANRYCDGANCRADVDTDDPCTKNEMCPNGNFCDVGPSYTEPGVPHAATGACTALAQAGDPCLIPGDDGVSNGCSPSAPFCISVEGVWECSATLHEDGDVCYDMVNQAPYPPYYYFTWPSECEAGLRCEMTAPAEYTCTTGADLGDDCDNLYADDEFLDCGAGLTCKDECVEQVGPGEDCEDRDTEGAADGTLCTNSVCLQNWDENGPDFICSDAPVPESNGGDDLTCGE